MAGQSADLGDPTLGEGVVLGGVGEKASPAEGGTESRGVDGDDGLESGDLIAGEQHLLVRIRADRLEYSQRGVPPRVPTHLTDLLSDSSENRVVQLSNVGSIRR